MTRWCRIPHPPALPAAVSLLLALIVVGCGESEPSHSAAAPTGEVRGEPIRGEPIVAPPASSAPVAASSTPVPTPPSPPGDVTVTASGVKGTPAASNAPTATATATPASAPGPATASASGPVAPAASATPAPAAAAVGAGTADAPLTVGFERLASFQYAIPDGPVDTNTVAQAPATNQIPDTIKGLNNRFVSLKGFMLPLKVEKGLVTELLVMRDQSMCCYGTVPRINEWVSVKMVGAGVKPIMDQAVTFVGKLKVGEMYENGYLVGIYALDGERMTGPLDL